MQLRRANGRNAPVRMSTALMPDDFNLSHRAARADMGVGLLPVWLVDEGIASGPLVRVLPQWADLTVSLYASYTSRRLLVPKVRSLMGWLLGELGSGDV